MSKPLAVLISDIHFSISTLPIASAALQCALNKAEELHIPLVIAGDLNDTKAIIRAEVANEIIRILKGAKVKVYILVGNHDLVNEKAQDHGLNYLRPYAQIIDEFIQDGYLNFIPYQTNPLIIKDIIANVTSGSILIMHQGFLGANLGDYIQDRTSIDPEVVKNFTVISGHYHKHQTIGTVTYIGSPYTMSYGEANDGPKGFLVLHTDSTFVREILYLRKHIKLERTLDTLENPAKQYVKGDLVWIKVSGPYSELKKLNKKDLGTKLFGHSNFKLDLVPTESEEQIFPEKKMTHEEIFDTIIDSISDSSDEKKYLKRLWREITQG